MLKMDREYFKKSLVQFQILEDKRRLTVAITRAKQKLIVLGDVSTMKRYTPFAKLFTHINENCTIKISEETLDTLNYTDLSDRTK